MEFKRRINHEVKIAPTHNDGFIMKIGCGRFAYIDPNAMLSDLRDYLNDPEGTEAKYNNMDGKAYEEVVPDRPQRESGWTVTEGSG